MNDYCGNGKILIGNYDKPEIEEKYPEFYRKVKESDAWMKYMVYLIIDMSKETTRNDSAKAWNAYVDTKKLLVAELNEKNSSLCDYIVGGIIKHDLAHWTAK